MSCFVFGTATAQETKKEKAVQIAFAYPLSNNGMQAKDISNKFSFNIIFGLNGGLNGFELGGVANINQSDVNGVQIAGTFNYNKGNNNALNIAGVSNIITGNSNGIQISGVGNIITGDANGMQIAGSMNINLGKINGNQISTVNYAKEINGVQIGAVNIAGKSKGVQIGIVNVVKDGDKTTPIGMINIVKNGLYEFEVYGGESIFGNLNFKMGTERFYSIFRIGYSSYEDKPVFSSGFGFGTQINFAEKHKMNIDITANNLAYDNKFDGDLNLLNKLDLNYKYKISKGFSILAGPSLNVYVTKEKVHNEYGTLKIPYSFYNKESGNTNVAIWMGVNVGVAYRL